MPLKGCVSSKRNFCGDEMRFECLDSNPKIKAWAAAKNMSYFDLEQYFWTRMNEPGGVIPSLTALGKVLAVAEGSSAAEGSVKLGKFPEGTIAEVWGATTLMEGAYGVLNNNSNVKAILGGPCAWQPSDRLPCHLRPFHQSNRLRRNAAARRLP